MNEDAFHEAITTLETLAQEEKAPNAWRGMGDQTVEDFWRAWPQVRAWGEWLWHLVDAERSQQADPSADVDSGGGG